LNYSDGEDFVFAKKRRHAGKEEWNYDLSINPRWRIQKRLP
jgi:hypothetical protein